MDNTGFETVHYRQQEGRAREDAGNCRTAFASLDHVEPQTSVKMSSESRPFVPSSDATAVVTTVACDLGSFHSEHRLEHQNHTASRQILHRRGP